MDKRTLVKISFFSLALAGTTSAIARPAVTCPPVACPAEASPRDGFYLGAGVGETFNRYELATKNTVTGFNVKKHDNHNSTVGNAFLGYGYTASNSFFLGVELGTIFPRRSGTIKRPGVTFTSFSFVNRLSVQDYLTGDLLPGYRINERWLIYARAGFSYAHLSLHQDANAAASGPKFNRSDNKWGGRIGLGVNYGLTKHLGLGLDYFYTGYQKMNSRWPAFDVQFKQSTHSHYLGISLIYSFR
jgi:outer membrane immunogenic protein